MLIPMEGDDAPPILWIVSPCCLWIPWGLLRRREDADAQFVELLGVDGRRCVGHRVRPRLRLREGDDLADVVLAGQHRDEAVDAEGEATVWRGAVPERVEEEPEPALGLL